MSSIWDWLFDYHRAALQCNDYSALRLVGHYMRAGDVPPDSPDERFAAFEAGHALAVQMREPWWEMFFEGWKISTLLVYKQDARAALDLAARAALEVVKPVYDGSPFRASINLELVAAYRALDPIAHEKPIRAAFEVIRRYGAGFDDFRPHYLQQWAAFLDALEEPDCSDALAAAWDYVAEAQNQDEPGSRAHYGMSALNLVCKLLVRYEPATARAQLGELAALSEIYAREKKRDSLIASALMWRAVAARWNDEPDEAARLYRRAFAVQNRMTTPHNAVGLGAMVYHQTCEEWDEALRVCQAELRVLRRHGLGFQEARLRLKKLELLRRAGRDIAREVRRTRAFVARLPSHKYWDAKIGSTSWPTQSAGII